MTRLMPVLLAAGVSSCGAPGGGGRLGFELFLERAVPDRVGFLQVALLSKGNSYACDQVQRKCLVDQVKAPALVPLTDPSGKQHLALLFPLALDGGGQELSVSGIPVGENFAVVVEALTKESPPRLYGSYCQFVTEISAGTNQGQTVFAAL